MRNAGFDFSRVMLGTVQFGLDYGIAKGGRPSYEACRDIVACALESGINCFDTAAAYGESEQVLGNILAELKVADQVVIVSKCMPVSDLDMPSNQVPEFIENSLQQSLQNLQIKSLPIYLFHRDGDLPWMNVLHAMKEKGMLGRVGISVDMLEGAKQAVGSSLIEAMQLPHNLFDHRFSGEVFDRVQERNIPLFARSAFLQGLLVMPEERIPKSLHEVVPARQKVEALAREAGMGMPELCLRYSLGFPAITSVLIGVDSVEQLRENATMMQRGPLDQDLIDRIDECVPNFPESIVRPGLWQQDD